MACSVHEAGERLPHLDLDLCAARFVVVPVDEHLVQQRLERNESGSQSCRVNLSALREILQQSQLTPELYRSLLNYSPLEFLANRDIPQVLAYYRSVEELLSQIKEPHEWNLRWQFSGVISALLLQAHEKVLEALIQQDPVKWRHTKYIGLYSNGQCSVDEVARLARWVERAENPILRSVERALTYYSNELVSRLSREVPWEFLGLEGNLNALGSLLSRDGILSRWRRRLAEFSRARAARHS